MFKIILLLFSFHALADWYDINQIPARTEYHEIKLGEKTLKIASHNYFHPEHKKTIITIHGYLVNCGYLKSIHEYFFQAGYNLKCFELPGHGKSEGPRSRIDDFSHYGEFFNQILEFISDKKQKYLIAHSTGCVGAIQALLSNQSLPFKHTFLTTPLVRSYHYNLTRLGYFLASSFIDKVDRNRQRPYKSKVLYQLRQDDPYWLDYTPVSWVGKLIEWNNRIEDNEIKNNFSRLTIYYGGRDKIVETPYNREFLQNLLPQAQHKTFSAATHDIFYDPIIDKKYLNHILNQL